LICIKKNHNTSLVREQLVFAAFVAVTCRSQSGQGHRLALLARRTFGQLRTFSRKKNGDPKAAVRSFMIMKKTVDAKSILPSTNTP
jgi:hypothetical protein